MSDIVERLHLYVGDDHERLCQGREYSCSCGYDDKRDPLLKEAAFEIGRLLNLLADARTESMELRAALELYRDAVRIDATMEGPKFMGANSSALKRAWDADLAALEGK